MTQMVSQIVPRGWVKRSIESLATRVKGGHDAVTEQLASDDSGEIAVLFSGDLKNAQEIQVHKRIKRATLETALRETEIKNFLKNKPLGSKVSEQQLHKIEQKILQRIPEMLLPEKMTILVALARSTAGAVGTYSLGNALVNRAIVAITPDPDKVMPDLLFYYFKNLVLRNSLQEELMPGQKTYVSIKDIKRWLVPLPASMSQQEQLLQRIEALLSGVKSTQNVLQKNKNIGDQLLEGTVRETFTKERMDQWQARKLGDYVELQSGKETFSQDQHGRYPFVKADAIDGSIAQLIIERGWPTRPPQGFLCSLQSDSLLYASTFTAETGWRSRVAMPFAQFAPAPERLCCNEDIFALTVRDTTQLQPRFLFWALQHPGFTGLLLKHGRTQNRLRVSEDQLRQASFHFPKDYAEQARISAYLDACQEQLVQIKKQHDAGRLLIDQMESSILDRAFRGEI